MNVKKCEGQMLSKCPFTYNLTLKDERRNVLKKKTSEHISDAIRYMFNTR